MRIPAFIRLTIRNVRVNTDPGTMLFMLGLPALYLVVLGIMFQGIIPSIDINSSSISYTKFLAPGIVGMQAFTAGNIGGGMLWSDRRWGMFEQLLVGPFRRSEYLLGIMVVSIIFSLGGSAIMIALAISISGSFAFTAVSAGYLILILVAGTIFFSCLFLIISIVVRTMQAYNTIAIFLFFTLDFASTAFYPLTSKTPLALRAVSDINPLSYVANVVRDAMVYGVSAQTGYQTLIVLLLMFVFFGISLYLYRNVQTGL